MKGRDMLAVLDRAELVCRTGRVRRILPTSLEADGPDVPLGSLCEVEATPGGGRWLMAQVIAVNPQSVTLAPFETPPRTFSGATVRAISQTDQAPVGDAFIGRAVDPFGVPIDGGAAIQNAVVATLDHNGLEALDRASTREPLVTGVRAIDGLLTLAKGQRVGLFAASGVGKTSLMGQLARQVKADRCVICLVGERGREVEALWSSGLADAKQRSVLVAATADRSAAQRVRAANYALALAEHWRDQGLHVLLLLDSATRLAMAMREIGLAAGEPPTVRAFTPGVFAMIPKLVERCGAARAGGAISAVFTVLSENDEVDDPISEMMKSILDGHIILSRALAEEGHFPAIDVGRSVSRLANFLMRPAHRTAASSALAALARYETSRTLIETGVYAAGANVAIDEAIALRPGLQTFLRQLETENLTMTTTIAALATAVSGRPA